MINLKQYNLEQIKNNYQTIFETEKGQIVLEDLKRHILETEPFAVNDTTNDSLLREGARQLLNFILTQLD
jgi:hypothetical protein